MNISKALESLEGQGLRTPEVREAVERLFIELADRTGYGEVRVNPKKLSRRAQSTYNLLPGQLDYFRENTELPDPLARLLESAAKEAREGRPAAAGVKAPVMAFRSSKDEAKSALKGNKKAAKAATDKLGMMASQLSNLAKETEGQTLGGLRQSESKPVSFAQGQTPDAKGQQFFESEGIPIHQSGRRSGTGKLMGVPIGELDMLMQRMSGFYKKNQPFAPYERSRLARLEGENLGEVREGGAGRWEERRTVSQFGEPEVAMGSAREEEVPKRGGGKRKVDVGRASIEEEGGFGKEVDPNMPRTTEEFEQNRTLKAYLEGNLRVGGRKVPSPAGEDGLMRALLSDQLMGDYAAQEALTGKRAKLKGAFGKGREGAQLAAFAAGTGAQGAAGELEAGLMAKLARATKKGGGGIPIVGRPKEGAMIGLAELLRILKGPLGRR